jgi:hypothetical protein
MKLMVASLPFLVLAGCASGPPDSAYLQADLVDPAGQACAAGAAHAYMPQNFPSDARSIPRSGCRTRTEWSSLRNAERAMDQCRASKTTDGCRIRVAFY